VNPPMPQRFVFFSRVSVRPSRAPGILQASAPHSPAGDLDFLFTLLFFFPTLLPPWCSFFRPPPTTTSLRSRPFHQRRSFHGAASAFHLFPAPLSPACPSLSIANGPCCASMLVLPRKGGEIALVFIEWVSLTPVAHFFRNHPPSSADQSLVSFYPEREPLCFSLTLESEGRFC